MGGEETGQLQERVAQLNDLSSPLLELVATAVYGRVEAGLAERDRSWEWACRLRGHPAAHLQRAQSVLGDWDD